MGGCCTSRKSRFETAIDQKMLKELVEDERLIVEAENIRITEFLDDETTLQNSVESSIETNQKKVVETKKAKDYENFLKLLNEIQEYLNKYNFSDISHLSIMLDKYFNNLENREQYMNDHVEIIKFLKSNRDK